MKTDVQKLADAQQAIRELNARLDRAFDIVGMSNSIHVKLTEEIDRLQKLCRQYGVSEAEIKNNEPVAS